MLVSAQFGLIVASYRGLQAFSPRLRQEHNHELGEASTPRTQAENSEAKSARPINGRGGRARTYDNQFWRPVLYQLSYNPAETTLHRCHFAPFEAYATPGAHRAPLLYLIKIPRNQTADKEPAPARRFCRLLDDLSRRRLHRITLAIPHLHHFLQLGRFRGWSCRSFQ